MKFRKKPVDVEATQWFKNGDHPDDNSDRMQPEVSVCEGAVVRYFRHPDYDGQAVHGDLPDTRRPNCRAVMNDHGWIDTIEGGHTVCPGDWIITGIQGERYPCEPDIFAATYGPVEAPPVTAPWRETVAEALWRHKMARPADEPMTWCVCLCWSTDRGALADDERAHNRHVADALAPAIERLLTEARAEALREAADEWTRSPDRQRGVGADHWLRDRAARIARTAAQPATSTEEER